MLTIDTTTARTFRLAPSAASEPPADVLAVIAAVIAANPDMEHEHFAPFVADHNHGEVTSEGSWSIACEGMYDWPWRFVAAQHAHRTVPTSVHIEPGAGWWLGVFPA